MYPMVKVHTEMIVIPEMLDKDIPCTKQWVHWNGRTLTTAESLNNGWHTAAPGVAGVFECITTITIAL